MDLKQLNKCDLIYSYNCYKLFSNKGVIDCQHNTIDVVRLENEYGAR